MLSANTSNQYDAVSFQDYQVNVVFKFLNL